MPTNKMLIDATHPEETRVVVLRNGRVEEFDYESAARKLLRGNIYLAKVTRVEPSLQAAFVDYGGNRHGFLAFNEIHPDYYQIPVADRQALLEEEAAAEAEEEAAADARAERLARGRGGTESAEAEDGSDLEYAPESEPESSEPEPAAPGSAEGSTPSAIAESTGARDDVVMVEEPENVGSFEPPGEGEETETRGGDADTEAAAAEESPENGAAFEATGDVQEVAPPSVDPETVEQAGSEDALEELPTRPRRRPRSYKIQEVIKRRQIILVQVVKEERGNKGAALTTYLSLAGRYTVLMPNTARGGGISRKITNPQDRKRLKAIAAELEVPEGMGLIIRTAGAARTKQEIKRDFEYLLRLWESVRDLTLQSTAPSLVYEEGNLIKRSIRDLYNKDVDEIVVAGEQAHKEARDFMRMLMPSHVKNVVLHEEPEPLFAKYGIERQLNAMFSPYVTLKSGGYLVINQTEALVAIDVNSGKATREFSIEETALNTNLEAADEIARQLKLRDLAGLIVIDFIDMEEKRNNRAVERRLKEALRLDRARIQLGRISHFGLMEMSRQRLRSGVLEGSTSQCPHCQGTGIIRSTESVALAVLRALEDSLMAGARASLVATTTPSVALYILNNKRHFINDMEARHGIFISVQASEKMQGANFTIEKGHAPPAAARRAERAAVNMDWGFEGEGTPGSAAAAETEYEERGPESFARESGVGRRRPDEAREGPRRRRRRRGRRGDYYGQDRAAASETVEVNGERSGMPGGHGLGGEPAADDADAAGAPPEVGERQGAMETAGEDHPSGRRRRRGRRGGRRGRERTGDRPAEVGAGGYETGDWIASSAPAAAEEVGAQEASRAPSRKEDEPRAAAPAESSAPGVREPSAAAGVSVMDKGAAQQAAPRSRARTAAMSASSEPKVERVVVSPEGGEAGPEVERPAPARRGWWQKRLGGE
jgi:ribonuclease E